MRRSVVALLLVTLVAVPALGNVKLSELGTHVHGPKLSMDDLQGHTVVIEKWGTSG